MGPARLRREMLANHRAFLRERQASGNLAGRDREAARWAHLKVLDEQFTADVVRLRERFAREWQALPCRAVVPRLLLPGPFAAELRSLSLRHRVSGLVVVGRRFLPWLARPFPFSRLPGGSPGGRHSKPPLLRLNSFEDHIDLYVQHVLRGVTLARAVLPEGGGSLEVRDAQLLRAKQAVRRLRRLLRLVQAAPPAQPTVRRACTRETWRA